MPADAYQKLTPRQQLELLDEVSRQRGLAPTILEKDYWVCRTLNILFNLPGLEQQLIFKGGTSLSKVYHLIDRFSEDIDLSFNREFLGMTGPEHDPESATSNKDQDRKILALKQACIDRIQDTLIPLLNKSLESELGDNVGWSVEIDPQDPQTVLFHYPKAGAKGPGYNPPTIEIELGARSDHWPKESHKVISYLGETLNQPIGLATVQALAAERTFWEKATILHAECHRPKEKAMPTRYARHYHDLARLADAPIVGKALGDVELRRRVVLHKTIYFRSKRARYDLAQPGTFRLVPDESRLRELERDHKAMTEMFFAPPPSLSDILDKLKKLEDRINSLPS